MKTERTEMGGRVGQEKMENGKDLYKKGNVKLQLGMSELKESVIYCRQKSVASIKRLQFTLTYLLLIETLNP